MTVKGWEMLKQGGIFGWDQRLMGGYYTVADVSHNEIFFMLPFLPFGPRVAFHLMLLLFYLLFPLLLYWYARLEFASAGERGERAAVLALWIGLFVAFGYFDNLLYWGMVNSFIGLNFMLLDLVLFAYLRQGKQYVRLGSDAEPFGDAICGDRVLCLCCALARPGFPLAFSMEARAAPGFGDGRDVSDHFDLYLSIPTFLWIFRAKRRGLCAGGLFRARDHRSKFGCFAARDRSQALAIGSSGALSGHGHRLAADPRDAALGGVACRGKRNCWPSPRSKRRWRRWW